MKPQAPFSSGNRRVPLTDQCFHTGLRGWGGNYSSRDDENRYRLRLFHRLSRDLLLVSAREHVWEGIVFGLVVLASAWPVIYMVIVVIEVLVRADH